MDLTKVILVDETDQPYGTAGKLEAHQKGLLHRAFSIFIFNQKGEMLLQQRAVNKYHSGGLWTNACCSHPMPDEDILDAAGRRLKEEMNIETPVEKIFEFHYRTEFENGLIENEYDHVFAGIYNGPVHINREEAKDFCFKGVKEIEESLQTHPQKYSAWFRIAFPRVASWWYQRHEEKVVGSI